ncbi:hypothetical protein LTR86_006939 [Recurvomyces mirabilis]|nr:hypothetical protein LTR86_006939 [Recurvomyces mirabilis]
MARTKSPSHELVLLCCILLFAFSRVLGDIEAAAIHLRTGIAILRDARTQFYSTSAFALQGDKDVIHDLTVMFVQLDIESTMQDIDRGPRLNVNHDPVGFRYIQPHWAPSADITSPHDSMESWMYICHEMWRFISCNAQYRHKPLAGVPLQVIEQWHIIRGSIKSWRAATKDYLGNHPAIRRGGRATVARANLGPEQILDAIRALIIESHYFSCKRFIAESLQDPDNLKPFDRRPEALLETAEKVIALRRMYYGMKDIHTEKSFTTHVGIVEALLLLVHRTTFPQIRTCAQQLIGQFEEVQQGQTGLAAFFEGYTKDFMLIYEMPGH